MENRPVARRGAHTEIQPSREFSEQPWVSPAPWLWAGSVPNLCHVTGSHVAEARVPSLTACSQLDLPGNSLTYTREAWGLPTTEHIPCLCETFLCIRWRNPFPSGDCITTPPPRAREMLRRKTCPLAVLCSGPLSRGASWRSGAPFPVHLGTLVLHTWPPYLPFGTIL